jgi:hypothetical protein
LSDITLLQFIFKSIIHSSRRATVEAPYASSKSSLLQHNSACAIPKYDRTYVCVLRKVWGYRRYGRPRRGEAARKSPRGYCMTWLTTAAQDLRLIFDFRPIFCHRHKYINPPTSSGSSSPLHFSRRTPKLQCEEAHGCFAVWKHDHPEHMCAHAVRFLKTQSKTSDVILCSEISRRKTSLR